MAIPRTIVYHPIWFDVRNWFRTFRLGSITPAEAEARVRDFEDRFSEYYGVQDTIAFPFARTALYASLKSQDFEKGSEVLMPPITIKPMMDVVISLGLKPVSEEGTGRIARAAIDYAIAQRSPSVTLVHKGNIMKFTEGGFRDWGYQVAKDQYGAQDYHGGPWQIITRPAEYSVIATMNLNGDYISDALAAQVGGIGIAPGANINYDNGLAIFEATHGTAPKYAGQDKVNPSSLILSGEMMFRYMGWNEAADLIIHAIEKTIGEKRVTYDFHRLMDGATLLKCSEFGQALVENMD